MLNYSLCIECRAIQYPVHQFLFLLVSLIWIYSFSFRRSGPPRHEGRGSRGREGFSNTEDFGPSDGFDKDEPGRARESSRGRGRAPQRGQMLKAFAYYLTHFILFIFTN